MVRYRVFLIVFAALIVAILVVLGICWLSSCGSVITNIREGQTLSGNAPVYIQTRDSMDLFTLAIDGKEYGSVNVDSAGPLRQSGFNIPTYKYVNGPHILELGVGGKVYDRRYLP